MNATERLVEQLKAHDAEQAMSPPSNGQHHAEPEAPRGPTYELHRPWWKRLIGQGKPGGCQSCGQGEPWGWVQRQLSTPRRTVRLLTWAVTLIPRGFELARVLTSGRVDGATYAERMGTCLDCDGCVVVVTARDQRGKAYCGPCGCPKWAFSRLDRKNHMAGHECPRGLHGPRRNDWFPEFVRERQAEFAEAHRTIKLPVIGGDNGH